MEASALVQIDGHEPRVDGPYAADEGWVIGDEDLILIAMLQDPIFGPELTWREPSNHEYGGCYRVYDYQYPLFRVEGNYAGFACARSVGKTESIKARAFAHVFKRLGENMLITAPELIHLLPLTEAIEDRILDTRVTRDFLDTRGGKTGLTHRPFGAEFMDGTRLVGRIPKVTGPQPMDELTATPDGWKEFGELVVGDRVIGSDGKPTTVKAVHEKGELEVFALEFSDGAVVRATGDHRLRVRRDRGQDWQTKTVSEIRDHTDRQIAAYEHGRRSYFLGVPDGVPVHYAKVGRLPVDPWLLGVLLGDGGLSTHAIYLTNPDEEIVQGVEAALPSTCSLKSLPQEYRYLVIGEGRGKGKENRLNRQLRDLGLLGNPNKADGKSAQTKRIPELYMRASLDDRLALLQGLLDTDGTISKAGKVVITLDNFELIEQIAELGRSLGGWVSVREHTLKPYWQEIRGARYWNKGGTYWMATLDLGELVPFRLTRKIERCRPRVHPRTRAIKRVVSEGKMPTRCISVAANDELYLSAFFIPVFNTGVKGQHQPDLVIDEGQDYPEKGWTEIHETVIKDHTDREGNPDFTYHFYGVHSGARDSGFFKSINEGAFNIVTITAIQRPGWAKPEKDAAKARYGGTQNPDYRRNIYGEPGAAASAFFVTSRLMACVDQGPPGKMPQDSDYNAHQYVHPILRAEEVDELKLPMVEILDLPESHGKIYMGADLGLTNSPTVVSVFSHEKVKGVERLKLLRLYELHRFRTRQIRETFSALGWHFGPRLQSFGIDITGLGFPIWQEMEDDEAVPQRLKEVSRGYFFNAKVPVGVDKEFVTKDDAGRMKDQYGSAVEVEVDEWGQERLVTKMPMIEASTRYLREFVDTGLLMLPFDKAITTDMSGETQQRVRALGEKTRKPNAFHILDSFRAMAMGFKAGEVEEALEISRPAPVMDIAL